VRERVVNRPRRSVAAQLPERAHAAATSGTVMPIVHQRATPAGTGHDPLSPLAPFPASHSESRAHYRGSGRWGRYYRHAFAGSHWLSLPGQGDGVKEHGLPVYPASGHATFRTRLTGYLTLRNITHSRQAALLPLRARAFFLWTLD